MSSMTNCPSCGSQFDDQSAGGLCPKCLLRGARTVDPQGATQLFEGRSHKQDPPKPQLIDELFPELEILDVIGQGGMGFVYKARQKNLGREVAVKLLSTKLMDDPSFAERFSREARAMAMMNHPNIISIYDFGQRGPYYYLIMEYVDGLNLRQLVSSTKLEPAEAMQIVPQLCDALQYAHDRGIVHRDIKPENVLISQDGHAKIADFGLAKLTIGDTNNLTLTQTQQVMGTLNYMAPEQREHPTEVDHRADIYSLGVVIYELLTGELPLGRFSPPSKKVQLDVRLDEVVMRALEKEPAMRFQQVSEFKTGIETVSELDGTLMHGGQTEHQLAQRIVQFVGFSIGITFGVLGVLFLVLSSTDKFIDEDVAIRIGFSGMALGGMICAMVGLFIWAFMESPDDSEAEAAGGSVNDQPMVVRIIKFLGFSAGISIAILGVLFIVLSGADDRIDEDVARTIGFAGMAVGGLICALVGIFLAVFTESSETQEEIKKTTKVGTQNEQSMPTSVLVINCIAMLLMFCGGLFFIAGSGQIGILDKGVSRFLGIASPMLGAALFAIGGMVSKAKGYKEK